MIRCKLCGKWVCKVHNQHKELKHLDRHFDFALSENVNIRFPSLEHFFEVIQL